MCARHYRQAVKQVDKQVDKYNDKQRQADRYGQADGQEDRQKGKLRRPSSQAERWKMISTSQRYTLRKAHDTGKSQLQKLHC